MKDIGILILRIGIGASMLHHGIGKLTSMLEGNFNFANPIGIGEGPTLFLATFSEFLCSILIIIGYKTKLASIPLALTMLVAVFITHFDDPWSKKELPMLYLTGYICLALIGAGKYSIDKK